MSRFVRVIERVEKGKSPDEARRGCVLVFLIFCEENGDPRPDIEEEITTRISKTYDEFEGRSRSVST